MWNVSYFGVCDILEYTYICFTPKYAVLFLLLQYITQKPPERDTVL